MKYVFLLLSIIALTACKESTSSAAKVGLSTTEQISAVPST
tara:strand:- start:45 stop:167 length:123 start_codon:yes stop_codon:yes gene_type:complete